LREKELRTVAPNSRARLGDFADLSLRTKGKQLMLKTIRARSIIVVAVVVLLSTAIAPPPQVKACPSSDVWTEYYDCALNQVGEKFRGCDCSGFDWGQLSGYFKEIEGCSCDGPGCNITWYKWNGSSWDQLSGPPSPEC